MPLAPGTRLGNYAISGPLGKGGMGEVYRGRDTKLERDVAIKVLPAGFAQHPDRLARFEREAKVLASLNHPNIATIYAVEESSEGKALVMELVQGETLKGPVPVDTALKYAAQIVSALDAAHEKGITHRDLKPANIMLTPEGVIKVLDFGLAAVTQPSYGDGEAGSNMATLTMSPTQSGMILGTAPYMSPEQAAGKPVDRRTDIWAFGVVLWELLTGKRLFDGEDIAHTLAAVLTKEPDWEQVPAKVRRLLRSCLEKDVKQRLQAAGDWRLLMDVGQGHALPETARPSKAPWLIAAVAALAALGLGYIAYRHATEEPPSVLKFTVAAPAKGSFSGSSIPSVSPDGKRLVFESTVDGKSALWVRDLDSLSARPLQGTDDGRFPFWSPDSRTVAFFAGTKLKRIDVAGGPAVTICDTAATGVGGTWTRAGKDLIVFGVIPGATFQVPAAGGTATPVTKLDPAAGEFSHGWPWLLPDGRHFLYSTLAGGDQSAVYVADLESGQRQRLILAGSNAVYTSGHLLFVRDRTLLAQPFDPRKLQATGDAVPIAEEVDAGSTVTQNQFSISQTGVLAYVSGGAGTGLQLTWFDRSGKQLGTVGSLSAISNWAVISPDGSTVATAINSGQGGSQDVWLFDLARGTESRFTFGLTQNAFPIWSPDGSHLAFSSFRDGLGHVFQKALDRGKDEVLGLPLGEPPRHTIPDDWSRDGRFLVERVIAKSDDLWVLPLFGDKKPYPYLQSEFQERSAKISPDGKWLAYASDETKRLEVYVQTFPMPGGKVQISTGGGERPVWSRDGRELFFIGPDRKMMAVPVRSGANLEAGQPKALFDTRIGASFNNTFDVSKDGRFLIPTQPEQSSAAPLTVVVNWPAGLKK